MTDPKETCVAPNTSDSQQRAAAMPISLGQTIGLFDGPADGQPVSKTAVLFIYPWGMEELAIRKFYRLIAEQLADAGLCSLRFELPHTANSVDTTDDCRWQDWLDATSDAYAKLQTLTGCDKVLIIGQVTGATLALQMAALRDNIAGLVLLAPALSGPHFLRELAAMSRLASAANRAATAHMPETFDWATQMPPGIAQDLAQIDLTDSVPKPGTPVLLVPRPKKTPGQSYFEKALQAGCAIEQIPFHGYEKLAKDLNSSQVPETVIQAVANWCIGVAGKPISDTWQRPKPETVTLQGPYFEEEIFRLGENDRFLTAICKPKENGPPKAVCILLTTAYHPMAGWGRINVEAARILAAQGVLSVRFDAANAADSPPIAGYTDEDEQGRIVWRPTRENDLKAVIAYLNQTLPKPLPIVVAGRCSGGYLAFIGAIQNPEITGVMLANNFRFDWKYDEALGNEQAFVPQKLATYLRKLSMADTWRRISRGKINLYRGFINISATLSHQAFHRISGKLGLQTAKTRLIASRFASLRDRGTKIHILYTGGDPSIREITNHFGKSAHMLKKYSDARLEFMETGDHNLSTPSARDRFLFGIEDLIRRSDSHSPR